MVGYLQGMTGHTQHMSSHPHAINLLCSCIYGPEILSIVVILRKFMTNVWLHLTPSAPPEESVLERRFWVPMSVSDISGLLATNDCCMHEPFQVRCTKVCFLGRNVFSLLKHSSHLKKLHDHCVATPYTLLWYTLCTTRGDCLETLFLGTNRNVSDISGMLNKIYVWLRYGAKD